MARVNADAVCAKAGKLAVCVGGGELSAHGVWSFAFLCDFLTITRCSGIGNPISKLILNVSTSPSSRKGQCPPAAYPMVSLQR
jgi:hypothetical protein